MTYLNDLRIEKAAEMLTNSTCFCQIKEIAFNVGISNDSRFTHSFKAKFQMTPTEFRESQAEIHQSVPPVQHKS